MFIYGGAGGGLGGLIWLPHDHLRYHANCSTHSWARSRSARRFHVNLFILFFSHTFIFFCHEVCPTAFFSFSLSNIVGFIVDLFFFKIKCWISDSMSLRFVSGILFLSLI